MKKKRKRKKEKGRGKGKRTVSRMRKQVYKSTDNQQEKMIDQIEGAEDTNNEDTARGDHNGITNRYNFR